MADIEQVKARAVVADYQAGRVAEIVDELQAFVRHEAASMPPVLRGKAEGLVEHAEAVARSFAEVNVTHEQHVARAMRSETETLAA